MEELNQIKVNVAIDGEFPCTSTLQVTQMTPNRFRLEETPFLMFEGGLHDIIDATRQEDGTYLFRGVLEKSKWEMHDFIFGGDLADSDAFKVSLNTTVEEFGGVCEIYCKGCVVVYLPKECDFDPGKEIARIAEKFNIRTP